MLYAESEPALAFCDKGASDVAGHYYHGIRKIDRSSAGIGKSAVIKHLKQNVENIGVCFFYLIEQNNAVRRFSHSVCKPASVLISDIARRRAYQL